MPSKRIKKKANCDVLIKSSASSFPNGIKIAGNLGIRSSAKDCNITGDIVCKQFLQGSLFSLQSPLENTKIICKSALLRSAIILDSLEIWLEHIIFIDEIAITTLFNYLNDRDEKTRIEALEAKISSMGLRLLRDVHNTGIIVHDDRS